MKLFKTIIWILVLFLIETVFSGIIGIRGTAPDLLIAFAAAYGAREKRLSTAAYVILACGILTGSMTGKSFPISVLAAAFAGISAFVWQSKAKFIPVWIKNAVIMIITASFAGAAEYFAARGFSDMYGLLTEAVPYAAYTVAVSLAVYPAVKRFIFGEQRKTMLRLV